MNAENRASSIERNLAYRNNIESNNADHKSEDPAMLPCFYDLPFSYSSHFLKSQSIEQLLIPNNFPYRNNLQRNHLTEQQINEQNQQMLKSQNLLSEENPKQVIENQIHPSNQQTGDKKEQLPQSSECQYTEDTNGQYNDEISKMGHVMVGVC